MDEMLKGVEGVMCYIDDIMVCSKTEAEHYDVLRQVFHRFSNTTVVHVPTKELTNKL